ncbi:MAG: aerotolerance regulator BatC [Bacteroidaceae bacterium]|nr:aerotolerance regulator BatC [Bacteroidaceae bacterium]
MSISKKHILFVLMTLFTLFAHAQDSDRDFIRLGNRHYRNMQFHDASTNYLKALSKKQSFEANYNLGNSLVLQGQDSTAFERYKDALAQPCDNALKKAKVYHNMGNQMYANGCAMMKSSNGNATQSFQQAIDLYKNSLRCNPADNETRYNLAMAQYMLKKSQQQGGGGSQDQNKDEKKDEENQQQQQDNTMSDEAAQQLLNSAQQDEKNVQKKVQEQKTNNRSRQLEKDW